MTNLNIPSELEEVFREFRTCEFSTLAKDSTPITWPVTPLYQPDKGHFLITTSIGLPQKAFNIRRNSRVSLLFSNSTGSGLLDPPAVLIQGDAQAPDEIVTTWSKDLEDFAWQVFPRQPAGELYSSNWLMRHLFDWYYMRLLITVSPKRILWWDHGDFSQAPREKEVTNVA
jgi:hypothetical protein